jgi:hypothetical protein
VARAQQQAGALHPACQPGACDGQLTTHQAPDSLCPRLAAAACACATAGRSVAGSGAGVACWPSPAPLLVMMPGAWAPSL